VELFEYNESMLVFDLRDMMLDEDFLKKILFFNVRNIKILSNMLNYNLTSIQSYKDTQILRRVYDQIRNSFAETENRNNQFMDRENKENLRDRDRENNNEITNLSLESISFNDFSKNEI